MSMTRSLNRSIARLLACVLLLAQLAVSAYACPNLATMSARVAMTDVGGVADDAGIQSGSSAMPGCMGMGALDQESANLCAEHCKLGQQSHEVPAVSVPLPLLTALYAVPLTPIEGPPSRPAAARIDALVAASPPLAVLLCVYRI
ncbi:hypothetical protein HLB44_29825 [Aquincola sp. S2]|uniref:Copper resistance protein n=1 Tax=Pseudaquabacterium terrae TaxID=2732868 RepID=A0ABX2ERQ0_9BURK|nr:hypothetical protein [Aquabacterium terrae]NRF71200.1 hypothetical protein [Aquabacterium terrae]